jgi:type IV secretory pathway VirB10-like protein
MRRKLFEEGMSMRQEKTLGVVLLVAGLMIAGAAVARMQPESVVQAQATPPAAAPKDDTKPAESMPGGTRPTTPAPEPARPQNNESGTTGTAPASPATGERPPAVAPALPPAPAEKVGPPVKER